MTLRFWTAAALLAASCGAAAAGSDGYCARLGPRDHFNSSGDRLKTVGAIVQQDRANYHLYGLRDRDDEDDGIFDDKISREALRRSIDRNAMSREDRNAILNGSPVVCVTVDGDVAFISSVR